MASTAHTFCDQARVIGISCKRLFSLQFTAGATKCGSCAVLFLGRTDRSLVRPPASLAGVAVCSLRAERRKLVQLLSSSASMERTSKRQKGCDVLTCCASMLLEQQCRMAWQATCSVAICRRVAPMFETIDLTLGDVPARQRERHDSVHSTDLTDDTASPTRPSQSGTFKHRPAQACSMHQLRHRCGHMCQQGA